MAEIFTYPKEAKEIILRSRHPAISNGYWDLQTKGFKYNGDVMELFQTLLNDDWSILELTGMKALLEKMVDWGGPFSKARLVSTRGKYNPDTKPEYTPPGLDLMTNQRNTGLYTAQVETRTIRAARTVHEGLFGIEIIGAPPQERRVVTFERLLTPDYISDAISAVTPQTIELERKPSIWELGMHKLAGAK